MNPACDADCAPSACTAFCQARRAYHRALQAVREAETHPDLNALAQAHLVVDTARRVAHALHIVPVGSCPTERRPT